MTEPRTSSLATSDGSRHTVSWVGDDPTHVVLLSHGYGEHIGRYQHVADALVEAGAAVYGLDHVGHGRSDGERAVVPDYDMVVADLHQLADKAREEHPGLPVVLVGHSMGGLVAVRYAQQHQEELAALVLSGPQVAGKDMLAMLLGMPEFPEFPIDPSVLSRDPAVGEAYLADPLVWHGGLQRPTVEAMVGALNALEEGPRLDRVPVLWLHGTDDQLSALDGARPVVESLATGAFESKTYPEARHEIFNETNRDEVLGDLTDFLHRTLASG